MRPKVIRIGKLHIPRKALVAFVIAIILIPVGFYLYNYSMFSPRNYAEEVTRPIEEGLIEGGAIRICNDGSNGFMTDAKTPYYYATFETNLNKELAEKLITKVASDSGYQLSHQDSPYTYIDWYSDNNKTANISSLQTGTIGIGLDLYSDGDKLGCAAKTVRQDASHVAIRLTVSLPARK